MKAQRRQAEKQKLLEFLQIETLICMQEIMLILDWEKVTSINITQNCCGKSMNYPASETPNSLVLLLHLQIDSDWGFWRLYIATPLCSGVSNYSGWITSQKTSWTTFPYLWSRNFPESPNGHRGSINFKPRFGGTRSQFLVGSQTLQFFKFHIFISCVCVTQSQSLLILSYPIALPWITVWERVL